MHAQAARRILIDKGLPHLQPVGLTVALRTPHRRPEVFHAEQWYLGRGIFPPPLAGEGRMGAPDQFGITKGPESIMER